MGSQPKTHITQTLKELYNIHTNMNKFLSLLALAALSAAAPQYGGGGGGSQAAPSRNPQPQAPAPTCRTEYVEVWDTRYVETEQYSVQQCVCHKVQDRDKLVDRDRVQHGVQG